MKVKFVTHGNDKWGPKLYRVMRYHDDYHGWVVEVCPCDTNGDAISDPIAWHCEMSWWSSLRLFWAWYNEYDRFVNCPR